MIHSDQGDPDPVPGLRVGRHRFIGRWPYLKAAVIGVSEGCTTQFSRQFYLLAVDPSGGWRRLQWHHEEVTGRA